MTATYNPTWSADSLAAIDAPDATLENAAWFEAPGAGEALRYDLAPGTLDAGGWLSLDMLLGGVDAVKWILTLSEEGADAEFTLAFGLLNECQARLRFPLRATDQNRWMLPREGALLKPLCSGDRVDPARVTRLTLSIAACGDSSVRFCVTPLTVSADEPGLIDSPLLPRGVLIDELGQSALRDWTGKSRSRQEVTARLEVQLRDSATTSWPAGFSRWGGDIRNRAGGSGFFRTFHDGSRWWLVDPEGHLFWSAGLDCCRPGIAANCAGLRTALADPGPVQVDGVDYLKHNLVSAFDEDSWYDGWSSVMLAFLRGTGFNTVGNWSDWQAARAAGFPYVRPLRWARGRRTPSVFRDMPDVFLGEFEQDAREFAEQLAETRTDPAQVGYFLMNEPQWGFAAQCPAEGMLYTTESCAARSEFARMLRERYGTSQAMADAWNMAGVTFQSVEEGIWQERFTPVARRDAEEFSSRMVERLFGTLTEACRSVDPNHLNLGARYHTVPPAWALKGMGMFDVFSINCYSDRVRTDLEQVCRDLHGPALIGEWHFGALDAGLPASGIGRVADQEARGRAYRVYLEDAAAKPWCVGAHWFTLYDQSALGRSDGENYNIGFLDICHHPYEELASAARAAHERLYCVATGDESPFTDAPQYLTRLFY